MVLRSGGRYRSLRSQRHRAWNAGLPLQRGSVGNGFYQNALNGFLRPLLWVLLFHIIFVILPLNLGAGAGMHHRRTHPSVIRGLSEAMDQYRTIMTDNCDNNPILKSMNYRT